MRFCDKVSATSDISKCCRPGLQGVLGIDRDRFRCNDTRKIDGSVNIDDCLKAQYPEENRWDYVLGYEGKVFFVEVHSANTSEINTVLDKLAWLKRWLKAQNSPLLSNATYHWVTTKNVNLIPSGKQVKQLALSGLKGPKKKCICNL